MINIQLGKSYRYEEMLQLAIELATSYSELIHTYEIGKSEDGRSIIMLEIGKGNQNVIYTAGVHGRETINPIVLFKILHNYAQLYEKRENIISDYKVQRTSRYSNRLEKKQEIKKNDLFEGDTINYYNSLNDFILPASEMKYQEYDVYELLNKYKFYVIPLLNPDGYEIALGGYDVIQNEGLREVASNSGIEAKEWKGNARGVDINRNFPAASWKAKYEGDYPASESETKALITLFHRIPAIGYADLHSRGEMIYYYRKAMPEDYNERQKQIANHLQAVTEYVLMDPSGEVDPDDTGGNTVHYFSEYFDQPALTIETVDEMEKFPLAVENQAKVFADMVEVLLGFAIAISESRERTT